MDFKPTHVDDVTQEKLATHFASNIKDIINYLKKVLQPIVTTCKTQSSMHTIRLD